MIKLYQFPPVWGLPNTSPFCLKVETYLRMAGLAYEPVYDADVRKAPKGKLPYIDDQGRRVADSGLILDYLKQTYGDPLDQGLAPRERALALAIQRLLEEHFYWCEIHNRWAVEEHWAHTKRDFFGFLPALLRATVASVARKTMLEELRGQGIGRHSAEEVYALGEADIDALALLGEQPYFLGERPTSIDATAYAFIANAMATPFDNPLKRRALASPNLVAYRDRMKERYYA